MASSVPMPLPLTLIASDSLLQHVAPVSTAFGGRSAALYLVKERGVYRERDRMNIHCEFALGGSVALYSAGGWDPASEDFIPHLEQMKELLQGVAPDRVEKVVVVLGINHVRGSLRSPRFVQENARVVRETAFGVFSVLWNLVEAFPRAEVYYLGTGRVWNQTPTGYNRLRASEATLAQVNAAGVSVTQKVREWYAIFPRELSRVRFAPNFWDGWQNRDTRDHYGHFARSGTLRFCRNLRALLPPPAPPVLIIEEPEDVPMPEAFVVPEEDNEVVLQEDPVPGE